MSDTSTIIKALRILARDIQSDDGVANAAIAEAADRLEELARDLEVTGKQLRQHELLIEENLRLKERIKRLEEAGDELDEQSACGCGVYEPCPSCLTASERWTEAKEAKP